jgi:hypothetical protein
MQNFGSDESLSHRSSTKRRSRILRAWLSDIEPRFTCQACGTQGADVRPDFDWEKKRPDARRFPDDTRRA